jgi:leucine dehydrogenase
VIGLGHVGARLAERLTQAGARLLVSDINPARRELAGRLGAEWVAPERAATAECDVLAPCALGGTIDQPTVAELRCSAVCGSANNMLADESVAAELHRRGILYAPDFIANAGGLLNVYGELHDLPEERVTELVDGIGPALDSVFAAAEERAITPLEAARELAAARLERARLLERPARLVA